MPKLNDELLVETLGKEILKRMTLYVPISLSWVEIGSIFLNILKEENKPITIEQCDEKNSAAAGTAALDIKKLSQPTRVVAGTDKVFNRDLPDEDEDFKLAMEKIYSKKNKSANDQFNTFGDQFYILASTYATLNGDDTYLRLSIRQNRITKEFGNPADTPAAEREEKYAIGRGIAALVKENHARLFQWCMTRKALEINEPPTIVKYLRRDLSDDIAVMAYVRDPDLKVEHAEYLTVDVVCKAPSAARFADLVKFFEPIKGMISKNEAKCELTIKGTNKQSAELSTFICKPK